MTVERFAISFDEDLASAVRKAAQDEPISAWLADAARRKLRAEGLLGVVAGWETRHGEITAREIEAVERAQAKPTKKRARRR